MYFSTVTGNKRVVSSTSNGDEDEQMMMKMMNQIYRKIKSIYFSAATGNLRVVKYQKGFKAMKTAQTELSF